MEDYVLTAEQHHMLFEILVGLLLIFAVALEAQHMYPGLSGFWFQASFPSGVYCDPWGHFLKGNA